MCLGQVNKQHVGDAPESASLAPAQENDQMVDAHMLRFLALTGKMEALR
jgi:hypothetical protein